MKLKVTKIGAAKSQLLEAINLFFEERDPVSIHTLVGAALDVLNDHITDKGLVWDHNLFFHQDSIYIKDEYRKEFQTIVRKNKNFFKHADRDLKKGITETEFDPSVNEFYIFEAIRTLGALEPNYWPAEFRVFVSWFMIEHPNLIKNSEEDFLNTLQSIALKTKRDYKKAIDMLKENPEKYMR